MPKMLNKNRPYGKCMPVENGVAYEQDGQTYDSDGYPVEYPSGKRMTVEQSPEPLKAKSPDTSDPDDEPPAEEKSPFTLDLQAYVRGELKNVAWPDVQAAVFAKTGTEPTGKAHALKLLKDAGIS